jgi:hypothetical protein
MTDNWKGQELDPHIDTVESVVFVTETQYTKGSLLRQQWEESQVEEMMDFFTKRASTDWVKLYRVTITRDWTLEREEPGKNAE